MNGAVGFLIVIWTIVGFVVGFEAGRYDATPVDRIKQLEKDLSDEPRSPAELLRSVEDVLQGNGH